MIWNCPRSSFALLYLKCGAGKHTPKKAWFLYKSGFTQNHTKIVNYKKLQITCTVIIFSHRSVFWHPVFHPPPVSSWFLRRPQAESSAPSTRPGVPSHCRTHMWVSSRHGELSEWAPYAGLSLGSLWIFWLFCLLCVWNWIHLYLWFCRFQLGRRRSCIQEEDLHESASPAVWDHQRRRLQRQGEQHRG